MDTPYVSMLMVARYSDSIGIIYLIYLGMINLNPPYGSILGGSGIAVTGDDLVISEEDEIMCTFDGIEIRGVYVNQEEALCISPMLERTGRLKFRLRVTGRNLFSGDSSFTSCMYIIP